MRNCFRSQLKVNCHTVNARYPDDFLFYPRPWSVISWPSVRENRIFIWVWFRCVSRVNQRTGGRVVCHSALRSSETYQQMFGVSISRAALVEDGGWGVGWSVLVLVLDISGETSWARKEVPQSRSSETFFFTILSCQYQYRIQSK